MKNKTLKKLSITAMVLGFLIGFMLTPWQYGVAFTIQLQLVAIWLTCIQT